MSGDWLDRVARAADERVSRDRLLRQAGVAALTVGPLGALLRAAPAGARSSGGASAIPGPVLAKEGEEEEADQKEEDPGPVRRRPMHGGRQMLSVDADFVGLYLLRLHPLL